MRGCLRKGDRQGSFERHMFVGRVLDEGTPGLCVVHHGPREVFSY